MTERVAAAAALHDALAGAVAGRGRLVLVTGEAGVGKTTLVRDATAAASDAGAQVVWTACWPEESDVHTPWRRALRSLGKEGAHV
ncbi:MAG TPA: AAA family ATPase, partial [Acidimicrobiia bacterium]|nr:AAA family ATPase [Acidimicrobiia bacterium]